MGKKVWISILVTTLLLIGGCVRYTHSREELNRPFGFDPDAQHVGIDAFYRAEEEQRHRLNDLIEQRERDQVGKEDATYRVGAGDRMEVMVRNFEEVSKTYTVSPAGTIRVPFVGEVHVVGKSEDQITTLLEGKLVDFLVDPRVSVTVTEHVAHVVWVVGGMAAQGSTLIREHQTGAIPASAHPLRRRDYTLVDLLIELNNSQALNAGTIFLYPAKTARDGQRSAVDTPRTYGQSGTAEPTLQQISNEQCYGEEFKEEGLPRRSRACYPYQYSVDPNVISRRYDRGARIEIDTEELFGGARRAPVRVPLIPGDIIAIPPSPIVQVFGEVRRRGTFRIATDTTSVGAGAGIAKPYLFSAIIAGDGLTYAADIHNIEIYRELEFGNKSILSVDLEQVVLRGGQDVRLRDGDIINVPSKDGRFLQAHTIDFINKIVGTAVQADQVGDIGN